VDVRQLLERMSWDGIIRYNFCNRWSTGWRRSLAPQIRGGQIELISCLPIPEAILLLTRIQIILITPNTLP
jgi:hypothetical protein